MFHVISLLYIQGWGGGGLSEKGVFYIFTVYSNQSNANIDVCNLKYSLRALHSFIALKPNTANPPTRRHAHFTVH